MVQESNSSTWGLHKVQVTLLGIICVRSHLRIEEGHRCLVEILVLVPKGVGHRSEESKYSANLSLMFLGTAQMSVGEDTWRIIVQRAGVGAQEIGKKENAGASVMKKLKKRYLTSNSS